MGNARTFFAGKREPRRVGSKREMPKASGLMTKREREICARVKLFREQVHWAQETFAREIDLTRDQLASIEYGRTPLRYGIARLMVVLFDVSWKWLGTGEGPVRLAPGDHAELIEPDSKNEVRLFTEVWDECFSKPLFPLPEIATTPDEETLPDFDVSANVIRTALRAVEDARLSSAKEKVDFANDVKTSLGELAASYRKQSIRDRTHFSQEAPSGGKGKITPRQPRRRK
jgi:transcriptional regulator with XRE-family HTH domain